MILIYVPNINERIRYTYSFIFEQILGIQFQLTDSLDYYHSKAVPKFSYSNLSIKDEMHFSACNLLFETDIKMQDLTKILKDPFATTFYLLSRYEEYLPYREDIHKRFSYQSSSINGKIDPIHPWIDTFAYDLFNQLKIISLPLYVRIVNLNLLIPLILIMLGFIRINLGLEI